MISSVDSNVILDVITDDPAHADQSQALLAQAYDSGALVTCALVYAELAPQFQSREDLDSMLSVLGVQVAEGGPDVAWLAGCKWAEYRKAGGSRDRLLPDFLIGAHAVLHSDCLLTRDRGFYKSYFPELKLMSSAR